MNQLLEFEKSESKEKIIKKQNIQVSENSLVKHMDSSELTTRELKLESMIGYNQENDDDWIIFPKPNNFYKCLGNCNPQNHVIIIPNHKPIIQISMHKFPNCKKCNTDNAVIVIRKEI